MPPLCRLEFLFPLRSFPLILFESRPLTARPLCCLPATIATALAVAAPATFTTTATTITITTWLGELRVQGRATSSIGPHPSHPLNRCGWFNKKAGSKEGQPMMKRQFSNDEDDVGSSVCSDDGSDGWRGKI